MAWKWSVPILAVAAIVVVSCSSKSSSSGALACSWCCSNTPTVTCECKVTTSTCPDAPPISCGSACVGKCVPGACSDDNEPPRVDSGVGTHNGDSGTQPSFDAGDLACGVDAAGLCSGIDTLTDVPCDFWVDCAAQECGSSAGFPQAVSCCKAGKLDNAVSGCQTKDADCEQKCVDAPGGPTQQCLAACQTSFHSCIDATCPGAGAAYTAK